MHNILVNMSNTNIIVELEDYMFTSKNINKYTKHIIQNTKDIIERETNVIEKKNVSKENILNETINVLKPRASTKNLEIRESDNENITFLKPRASTKNLEIREPHNKKQLSKIGETMYTPKQKDSLFWCFYILKNGFSNYEMEINNQYFIVEKTEKFKYIELLRKSKELLKIHKIKSLTEIENELANKNNISIKTFFALCAIEKINILLINKRKVYELLCCDVDQSHPYNIVHRNNETLVHSIEVEPTHETVQKYRETYYMMNSFDAALKSMGSYKLDQLLDLCKKLDINLEQNVNTGDKKKRTKKDIYELLVLNY